METGCWKWSLCHAGSCDEVWLLLLILLRQQCVSLDRNRHWCLCMPATSFVQPPSHIFTVCVFTHVRNLQNVLLNQKSGPVAPLNQMAGGVNLFYWACEGKGHLSLHCLFWEGCRSSCSVPVGRSLPVNSSLPLMQRAPNSSRDLDVSRQYITTGTYGLLWQYAETNTLDSANQMFLWISQPQHYNHPLCWCVTGLHLRHRFPVLCSSTLWLREAKSLFHGLQAIPGWYLW